MARTRQEKKSKKLKGLLFAAIALVTVGVIWAATNGTLNINGTANLTDEKVRFTSASNEASSTGAINSLTDDTLTFTVDLTSVADAKIIYFALENTSAIEIANVDGITFSYDTTGLGATEAIWNSGDVTAAISGAYGSAFSIGAGATIDNIVITVTWVANPALSGFVTITAEFDWEWDT